MPDIPSFEQCLAELEQIVRDLEDGQVGLEESLARYEKGIGLLKRCYGQLREAEQKIMLLTGVNAEDKPLAKPFEHNASVDKVDKPIAPPPPGRPTRNAAPPAEAPRLIGGPRSRIRRHFSKLTRRKACAASREGEAPAEP